jgi:DNA invertase Pin-like site-specific DNA recombinase
MTAPKSVAYSYIRFSTPEQAQGDSLRRQTEATAAWCQRHGVGLDTTLRDEGISAYKGSHRTDDRHALAQFLELVKRGRVPKGSYLIVENLDRLSREHVRAAFGLWSSILDAGVNIVQLVPERVFYHDRSDMADMILAIVELSRGHSESAMKSDRVGKAWTNKKTQAAESGKPMTGKCPAWLRLKDGKWEIIKPAAAAIRRIYQLATKGYGLTSITKKMNADGIPPIGQTKRRTKHWIRGYIGKILLSRAVVGELQPHKYVIAEIEDQGSRKRRIRRRVPDGEPLKDYYPALITEDEWFAARAALESRKGKVGRLPKNTINVFAGLLYDGRDGGRLHISNGGKRSSGQVLSSYTAVMGSKGTKYVSFPFRTFERAVLSYLREIDPKEILQGANGHAELMVLEGELGQVEAKLDKLAAELLEGDSKTIAKIIRQLEARQAELTEELAVARRKAANPLSASWGEAKSLLEILDSAPDPEEARLRLRAALRRIVEGVWCLFVGRGAVRLAAVQVVFTGGARRDYLIYYKPGTGGRAGVHPARTHCCSLADVAKLGPCDLRQAADAKKLEALLAGVNLEALLAAMQAQPGLNAAIDES